MRISTKLGDSGTTKILGEKGRVEKDHPMIEYLGDVDELQSILGMIEDPDINQIQSELYFLMGGKDVDCDWMQTDIKQQNNFILPKGIWNVARTVCRRAERRAVSAGVDCQYLNRLSDLLYKKSLEQ